MRLRIYLFAIATTLGGFALPAQAQDLGAIIDLAAKGSQAIERSAYNPCRYYDGLQKINCRVQSLKNKADEVTAFNNRIAHEQRRAQQRRDALNGGTVYNRSSVQICSWGDYAACQALGISQQQATQMLSSSATHIDMQVATVSSGGRQVSSPTPRRQLDSSTYAAARLRQTCKNGDQAACAYLGS